MAGYAVDRLFLTTKARAVSCVDQAQIVTAKDTCLELGGSQDPVVPRRGAKARCCDFDIAALSRISVTHPGGKTAIQHGDTIMPKPAQQPPGTRCDATVCGVINNNSSVVADAESAEGRRCRAHVRQRMSTARIVDRTRQIRVQVGINGAGHMPLSPLLAAEGLVHQVEATIDDAPVGVVEVLPQFRGSD